MTDGVHVIAERSGAAFRLPRGAVLTVTDPKGEQVADLLAYNAADVREVISSGRTLDYAETISLTTGHALYSNRSQVMLTIIADTVGRHDFLLTPCSIDTFHHFYPDLEPHRGCFGNLAEALSNLSTVLRARRMMREKVKDLSSEALASAGIIASLPPAVMTMVMITSPCYMMALFTDIRGNALLLVAGALMGTGIFVMKRMISFKI